MHRPRPARTSRRPALRSRRALAATLAALTAGGTAYLALHRPADDGVPAVVATSTLPVGHLLTRGDLEVRELPADALPTGALTQLESGVDRTVVAPLAEGEVLTTLDVRASALLTGLAGGTVAVFLPLSEPAVAASVQAADRVDVHSPVDGSVVVPRALVLRAGTGEQPGLWLGVDRAGAQALAAARGADPAGAALQVALHPQP
ncbi:SAF domain-containing protein [Ornithinimicrobium sufpigmenti]|uniref:SAF domain-containing protein n=1 Tax=Ornithinimicrobium sufpigmenti TaxID=2508882 RepID=UPI0015E18147|nr:MULTISPECIES: SAF domain-containing protein [unclassified Ornithinimicrobium]